MRRHHGHRQSSRARIEARFWNGPRAHRERQPPRRRERAQLRRSELRRIEIGKRVALECRPEIQNGGISLAFEDERGAEVLIGLHPLRVRHLEWPFRRHDLTQDRERAFDLEPLVQLTRLLQQLGGARLGGGGGGNDEQEREPECGRAPGQGFCSDTRRAMRPRETVLSAEMVMVVSKVMYPRARICRRRLPAASGKSSTAPVPRARPSMRISASLGAVRSRNSPVTGGRGRAGAGAATCGSTESSRTTPPPRESLPSLVAGRNTTQPASPRTTTALAAPTQARCFQNIERGAAETNGTVGVSGSAGSDRVVTAAIASPLASRRSSCSASRRAAASNWSDSSSVMRSRVVG